MLNTPHGTIRETALISRKNNHPRVKKNGKKISDVKFFFTRQGEDLVCGLKFKSKHKTATTIIQPQNNNDSHRLTEKESHAGGCPNPLLLCTSLMQPTPLEKKSLGTITQN